MKTSVRQWHQKMPNWSLCSMQLWLAETRLPRLRLIPAESFSSPASVWPTRTFNSTDQFYGWNFGLCLRRSEKLESLTFYILFVFLRKVTAYNDKVKYYNIVKEGHSVFIHTHTYPVDLSKYIYFEIVKIRSSTVKYNIKGPIMILEGHSSMSYCWGRLYLMLVLSHTLGYLIPGKTLFIVITNFTHLRAVKWLSKVTYGKLALEDTDQCLLHEICHHAKLPIFKFLRKYNFKLISVNLSKMWWLHSKSTHGKFYLAYKSQEKQKAYVSNWFSFLPGY